MKPFQFHMTAKVLFGRGRLDEIGEETAACGRRALIVTGRSSMKRLGFLERVEKSLEGAGVEHVLCDATPPNPTTSFIDGKAETARRERCDVIVAVGGGSSLDAAKGIAVAATNEGPLWDYIRREDGSKREASNRPLPLVAAPSTSGTGSETTPFAVITNRELKQKCTLRNFFTYPRAAIVDPELPATMPPRLTAATGVDAFVHAFENFTNILDDPVTDALDLAAMEKVIRFLPKAVEGGAAMEARSELAAAAMMAGVSIANSGVHMIHGLQHAAGGRFDIVHGEALAALLPSCIRFMGGGCIRRIRKVLNIFMVEKGTRDWSTDPVEELAVTVESFLDSVGLLVGLEELGVDPGAVGALTEDALKTQQHSIQRSPRAVEKSDVEGIYSGSMTSR